MMKKLFFLLISMSASICDASVIINRTRVIYQEGAQETSFQLLNKSKTTHLVQAWIDNGDEEAAPEDIKTPFILLPPIVKIAGESGQIMKVQADESVNSLPKDQESVFWVNVLDIPPLPKTSSLEGGNYLQVALRTRIKLFYRPKGLVLSNRIISQSLFINENVNCLDNRSPFYMSIVRVEETDDNLLENSIMIPPYSCQEIEGVKFRSKNKYRVSWLDDYGSQQVTEI
ncbi:fimbrial biogenesis chaperone [Vibrio cincinnatiensis]|uniref:fimbrial biogenesis chaperone n=1 Tax=Vibrio cincinnatiensis TaxID=675 RepID=UPI001E485007|nr:molecular chaperone [Vibrio cincinnatiensis]